MCQRVLPRTSFEERLPDGWFLSRLYKGNRILYYNDVKVASLADSFAIEANVSEIINNPPEVVQAALYQAGKVSAIELSSNVQKKLVKKGLIPYEVALNCLHGIESWLYKIVPSKAEYNGKFYVNRRNRWYDEAGSCISTTLLFLSTWDARVRYAQGKCTLSDVARYSWSAVLECLGDDHQRFINQVLKPKMESNRKGWVLDAKADKAKKLKQNEHWEHTEFNRAEEIEEEYREDVNSCLYQYFFSSLSHHVQMFTEDCNLPAFSDIKSRTEAYEKDVLAQLKSIEPQLCRFKWNALLKSHEPVFAPQPMSAEKRNDFYDLVHQVVIGQMSGHEAALHFVHGDWSKIRREGNRYEKHMTQYVPFYSELRQKLDKQTNSFTDAVNYIRNSVCDLIAMGYRAADKIVVSFTYDDCRFAMNVESGDIQYIGYSNGKFMSDTWLNLKPEERRGLLHDDAEWEYQEKAIKKYRRLFSYLYNVVHKHWDRASYFVQDKLLAKRKYLRPSSGFLDRMKEKADKYIKSLERRVAIC